MNHRLVPILTTGLLIVTGCTLFRPVQGPTVPHAGQRTWLDEAAVMNLVARYVYEAHFDRLRAGAERRYATLLRYSYLRASSGGQDPDGGQRAVNFIHKVHVDADGSRDLWKKVVALARESAAGEATLPLPPEVE